MTYAIVDVRHIITRYNSSKPNFNSGERRLLIGTSIISGRKIIYKIISGRVLHSQAVCLNRVQMKSAKQDTFQAPPIEIKSDCLECKVRPVQSIIYTIYITWTMFPRCRYTS